MTEASKSSDVLQLERRVLSLLCQEPAVRELGRSNLQHYCWRDLVHKVIFEIVTRAPQTSAEQLRHQLPTRLTNAGFPDFPWEEFFHPHGFSQQDAEALLLRLSRSG